MTFERGGDMGDWVWVRTVLPHTSRDRLANEQALRAGAPLPECPGEHARRLKIDVFPRHITV